MVIIGYGVACGGVGLVTGLVGQNVLLVIGRMDFFFVLFFVCLLFCTYKRHSFTFPSCLKSS